jgi:hypothetical protein
MTGNANRAATEAEISVNRGDPSRFIRETRFANRAERRRLLPAAGGRSSIRDSGFCPYVMGASLDYPEALAQRLECGERPDSWHIEFNNVALDIRCLRCGEIFNCGPVDVWAWARPPRG